MRRCVASNEKQQVLTEGSLQTRMAGVRGRISTRCGHKIDTGSDPFFSWDDCGHRVTLRPECDTVAATWHRGNNPHGRSPAAHRVPLAVNGYCRSNGATLRDGDVSVHGHRGVNAALGGRCRGNAGGVGGSRRGDAIGDRGQRRMDVQAHRRRRVRGVRLGAGRYGRAQIQLMRAELAASL